MTCVIVLQFILQAFPLTLSHHQVKGNSGKEQTLANNSNASCYSKIICYLFMIRLDFQTLNPAIDSNVLNINRKLLSGCAFAHPQPLCMQNLPIIQRFSLLLVLTFNLIFKIWHQIIKADS